MVPCIYEYALAAAAHFTDLTATQYIMLLPLLTFVVVKVCVFMQYAALTLPTALALRVLSGMNTNLWYDHDWLSLDQAGGDLRSRRAAGFGKLMTHLKAVTEPYNVHTGSNNDGRYSLSSRIPARFGKYVDAAAKHRTVEVERVEGNTLVIKGGERVLDLGGSFGVNVLGQEMNHALLTQAVAKGQNAIGLLMSSHRPLEAALIELVDFQPKNNFSQTELYYIEPNPVVSFHNSGTEAVEAAVRLSRYNTGRKYVVTFGQTYHGWTDAMISPVSVNGSSSGQMSLPAFSERSLETIQHYAYSVAAVVFNPMTCVDVRYNDSLLSLDKYNTSSERQRAATDAWLKELERICSMFGIVLVFDEVYGGFRLGPRLSCHYLTSGVRPDVVVLGKTIANGVPIGILVGSEHFLRRQHTDYAYDKAVVVGTFSMSALAQHSVAIFLEHIKSRQSDYDATFALMDRTLAGVNQMMKARDIPLSLSRVGLLVTTNYARKSPYNWLLQFYLLKHRVFTCAYGTARMNWNLAFTETEAAAFAEGFGKAAQDLMSDGWWTGPERNIASGIYLGKLLVNSLYHFLWVSNYDYIMHSKRVDLDVSHMNRLNFMTHFFSSLVFVPTYLLFLCTSYKLTAMVIFIAGQVLRQAGHFLFEADHSEGEQAKIGFRNKSKRNIIAIFVGLNIALHHTGEDDLGHILTLNLFTVIGLKVATACVYVGTWRTLQWLVKIFTDPFTDIWDFGPSTWMDYFTDDKVYHETNHENFVPKFAPGGKVNLGKILVSYFTPINTPEPSATATTAPAAKKGA